MRIRTHAALAAAALCMTSACGAAADTALCPADPQHRVLVVLPEAFSSAAETARIAAALDAALVGSEVTNTAVTLVKGASGTVIEGGCGFADDARLADERIRRAVAVTPIMNGFVAAYAQTSVAAPLDLLGAARTLSHHAGRGEGPTTAVVILAPRLRAVAGDAGVSFAEGRYPSDGMLFASPEQSVFSVVGRNERLAGLDLYFAATDEDWESALHAQAVDRFWHWWATRQGANVRTMNDGFEAALRLALAGEGRLGDAFDPAPKESAKPEMLDVNPPELPEPFVVSAAEFRAAPQFNAPARIYRGALSLGVVWDDAQADVDLHAAAVLGGPELYYGETRVEGLGIFEKRTEDGRSGARGFEFVEFAEDVDIRQAAIFINLYEMLDAGAPARAVTGELRVVFDGAYYSAPFAFPPMDQGNFGEGRLDESVRSASPYWIELRLEDVVPQAAG